MNKIFSYIFTLAICFGFLSCNEDKIGDSNIDVSQRVRVGFDKWLVENYVYPYNIEVQYKMKDIESSMKHDLVPADLDNSKTMAKLVKYLWLEAYDEIAGSAFTRKYAPKVLIFTGSAAWNANGTRVVGSAEGGKKVTLYELNDLTLDVTTLNKFYFHTMHHEFAHILNQQRNYDPNFKKVSAGKYIGGNWEGKSNKQANTAGFVTPYSMQEPGEDFVELLATYILCSEEEWDALLVNAESEGAKIITEKMDIVYDYMEVSWGINLDKLRKIIKRRSTELNMLDL